MSVLQSIAFNRNSWNMKEVFDWLDNHNIFPMKEPHITKNYIRIRIQDPKKYSVIGSKKIQKDDIILYFGAK